MAIMAFLVNDGFVSGGMKMLNARVDPVPSANCSIILMLNFNISSLGTFPGSSIPW